MVLRTLAWGEVWLTSCLFCLDSAALLVLNEQQFYLFGQIQTSQTGSPPYIDTSLYKVSIPSVVVHLGHHQSKHLRLGDINKSDAWQDPAHVNGRFKKYFHYLVSNNLVSSSLLLKIAYMRYLKMGQPAFSFIFGLFKQTIQFLQQI